MGILNIWFLREFCNVTNDGAYLISSLRLFHKRTDEGIHAILKVSVLVLTEERFALLRTGYLEISLTKGGISSDIYRGT